VKKRTPEESTAFRFLRVPMAFARDWINELSLAELRVWVYILRYSLDRSGKLHPVMLTHLQIANGTQRADGKMLDRGTRLSIPGVRKAIRRLVNVRHILKVEGTPNQPQTYTVLLSPPDTAVSPAPDTPVSHKKRAVYYAGITQSDTPVSHKPSQKIVSAPRKYRKRYGLPDTV
jgi:hypothetical protein